MSPSYKKIVDIRLQKYVFLFINAKKNEKIIKKLIILFLNYFSFVLSQASPNRIIQFLLDENWFVCSILAKS